MGELSKKEEKVLRFIVEFRKKNGFSPNIREIGDATGISSTSVVSYDVGRLEEKGMVTRHSTLSRSIVPTSRGVVYAEMKKFDVSQTP